MSHFRTALRARIATLLTAAGLRTFHDRVSEIEERDMPCAIVFIPVDASTNLTLGRQSTQQRIATVQVQIMVPADDGALSISDSLCATVETVLLAPAALAGFAKSIELQSTVISIDSPDDGTSGLVVSDIIFGATIFTHAGSPAVTR